MANKKKDNKEKEEKKSVEQVVKVVIENPKSKKDEKAEEKKVEEKKIKKEKKEKEEKKVEEIKKNGYEDKKLGNDKILTVNDKKLNGRNYKEIKTYSGVTFLLSKEDLDKQIIVE